MNNLLQNALSWLVQTGYLHTSTARTAEVQENPIEPGESDTPLLAPWFQQYGIISWAPKACNVLFVALRASKTWRLAIGADDGRRKTLLQKEGEVVIYDKDGAVIRLSEGKITIDAPAGKDVVVNGGTAGVAREGDFVEPTSDMTTWMTQVSGYINGQVAGTVSPPTVPTIGEISSGAGRFKA